tara:strand:- start:151 stop:957 length:807 start_codon:yes stop_codon:yes gene_type:complete
MPTYTLSNRLPDPDFQIGYWGAGGGTTSTSDPGPGFASVKLTSDQKVMVSRTNSQRVLAKSQAGQKWNIDIGYHPMTQDEFRPIDSFLQSKQGALTPFFVALPQYNNPKNQKWKDALTGVSGITGMNGQDGSPYVFSIQESHAAGETSIHIGSDNWTPTKMGGTEEVSLPRPGEMVTIADSSDTNHTKAYMITHVETNTTYISTDSRPSSNARLRLGVSPPLVKDVSTNGILTFLTPLFKVVLPKAVRSYSLNTNNLYKFSLKLEEYL